jgi:hypothetical protein
VTAPKPAADLAPVSRSYKATLRAGGEAQPMTVTRSIKDEGGSWVVTESATLPQMGGATITSELQQ